MIGSSASPEPPARPGLDALVSRIFFDPFHRPGRRREIRRKALELTMHLVHRAAARRDEKGGRLAWQELSYKLRVFALFSQVDWVLSLSVTEQLTLPALVHRARALGPDDIPWVMEGIGQSHTQSLLAGEALPVDLLGDARLPEWSLGTLHTGFGMALAVRSLAAVETGDPDRSVARNVERFLTLCDRCTRPGYTGMAVECLGFVLRFLHPQHLAPADAILREQRPELVALLWHGAGRALYFLPRNLPPGRSAPWQVFTMAEHEAPHELARQNLLAGLAWPFLLVNWQQPRILETVLGHHSQQLYRDDCFSSGLGAAMVMWVDCTAGETRITDLLDHRPVEARLAAAWESLLAVPCLHALTRCYPLLKRSDRLDQIFRYPIPRS